MKRFLLKVIARFAKAFCFFLIFIFSSNFLVAQTCGVEAKFDIEPFAFDPHLSTLEFYASPTTFQANWVAYGYQWKFDDTLYTTNISMNNWQNFKSTYYPGLHEACLYVYARNTITGDSCVDSYCNIYESTGNDVYLSFNVQQTGPLTIDFYPEFFGMNDATCGVFDFDYGDGTTIMNPPAPYSHTYASAGDYVVKMSGNCYNMPNGPWVIAQRTIHVNNGHSNFIPTSPIIAQQFIPDSIRFSVSSLPPFPQNPICNFHVDPYYYANTYGIQNGVMTGFKPPCPGQYMIVASILDSVNAQTYVYGAVPFDYTGFYPDTITGTVYHDNDADGIRDSNEIGIQGKEIQVGYNGGFYKRTTDSSGFYSMLLPHQLMGVFLTGISLNQLTYPASNSYFVNFNTSSTHPNYNFLLADLTVHVCGKTYIDYNQDSIYGTPDVPLKLATIHAYNSITGKYFSAAVNGNGDYCIDLPAGNYTFWVNSYILDSAYYTPDSVFINSIAGNFSNVNFGFYSTQVGGNLAARVYDSGNPRPGFDYYINAPVRNTGIDTTQGTLKITYDSTLVLTSVITAGGIVDSTNRTVTWQTGVLAATIGKYFTLKFNVPSTTPLGTPIGTLAVVTADSGYVENNLQNNSDGEYATVVGSFDPNDKVVSPTGYNASGGVPTNQRLYYRINFQNTGTASAINVIVQDQIDSSLDMNTFIMERASHAYKMVSNDRTVTWKFLNINLPDSNSNEPLSHGFIEYSIMPNQGLPNGTVIPNTANIYFDFNAPVATNTVTNTITDCSQLQLATVSFSNTTLCKNDTLAAAATLAFPMQTAWYVDGIFVGNGLTIATDTLSAGNHLIEMTAVNSVCTQTISQTVFVDEPVQPTFIANGNLLTSSSVINNQWYLNGSSIAGATQNTFTISQSGWYLVAVTDSLGCIAFSDSLWVSPVGLEEVQAQNIIVSPNPFTNELAVFSVQLAETYGVKIFDILGKEIFYVKNINGNFKINTGTWAKGVYDLRISLKDSIVRKKIVKE